VGEMTVMVQIERQPKNWDLLYIFFFSETDIRLEKF
jgi:hypothetical protein